MKVKLNAVIFLCSFTSWSADKWKAAKTEINDYKPNKPTKL